MSKKGGSDTGMRIDTELATHLGKEAMKHLSDTDPGRLEKARKMGPHIWKRLTLKRFLEKYCWVVYASGFSFAVVETKFPLLKHGFKAFEPEKLCRMRSIAPVLAIINNAKKARNFLDGAQAVIQEGFPNFKRRIAEGGPQALTELPGIGPITKDHLAKNIGLADVPKADIWLRRAAKICRTSVTDLTQYIANETKENNHTVDIAIWTFGKDGRLGEIGSWSCNRSLSPARHGPSDRFCSPRRRRPPPKQP